MSLLPPTDHRDLEILSPDECDRRLQAMAIGRVAFTSRGGPMMLPVTYKYIEGRIVFRTSYGEKLAAADRADQAAFEIDAWDDVNRTGWSVVVQGKMERVTDLDELADYDESGLTPWARERHASHWIKITPAYVTGRAIR